MRSLKNRVVSDEAENEQSCIATVTGSATTVIGFVGQGRLHSITASIAHAQAAVGETVIIQQRPAAVTINGVGYYEVPKSKPSGNMSRLATLLLAFASFDDSFSGRSYSRQLPRGINIIDEYGKIQLKQSGLGKWDRERVVSIFESSFRRVE